MGRLAQSTLAAAATVGVVTAGLTATAVAATPAVAVQHVTPGSTWELTNKDQCVKITFGAGTWAADFMNESGTWSGGRRWVVLRYTADDQVYGKYLGTYRSAAGGFAGHFAYASQKDRPKGTLDPGTGC